MRQRMSTLQLVYLRRRLVSSPPTPDSDCPSFTCVIGIALNFVRPLEVALPARVSSARPMSNKT